MTTTTNYFHSDMAAALEQVKAFEGDGKIINEHYSQNDYIKRRHGFLGSHPEWKLTPGMNVKARREANEVWAQHLGALSVQHVRDRELKCMIEPLTPLPTTANCDSLDDFASYPEQEWKPGMEEKLPNFSLPPSTPQRSVRAALSSGSTRRSRSSVSATPPGSAPTSPIDSGTVLSPAGETAGKSVSQQGGLGATNFDGISTVPEQTTSGKQKPAEAGSDLTTTLPQADAPQMSPPQFPPTDEGISAAAGRAMHVPVKPQNRGVKRSASTDPADYDSAFDDEGSATENVVPRKKLKINVTPPRLPQGTKRSASVALEREDDSDADGPDQSDHPARKKPKLTLKATPSKERITRPVKSKTRPGKGKIAPVAATQTPVPNQIQRIANGDILPKSRKEADEARTYARAQLLKTVKNGRKLDDLEFWNPDTFTAAEKRDGAVRCACGSRRDEGVYGQEWIGCDDCNTWQHVVCMGDAVDSEPNLRQRDDYKYKCHACDPFRHRKMLQKLRKGEEIS